MEEKIQGTPAPSAEEKKKQGNSEIGMLTLIAIALVGRVLLEPFPSVEPIIPIAVYAGLKYKKNTGTIVGLLSYPLANVFMLGGPFGLWSLLQATGGAIAGSIAEYGKELNTSDMVLYTAIGTLIFEFIMNVGNQAFLIWPFSITHIVTNVIIALVISGVAIKQ